MSFQTLKRAVLLASAVLLAQPLLAADPSARAGARAVFDESTGTGILFGGVTAHDAGSARNYQLDETWEWDGTRWIHRYPATSPTARSSHAMTYDSARERIVLFGGTDGTTELNDTWFYKDRNWARIETPNAPDRRILTAIAYDPLRDRVVIYGGMRLSDDKKTTVRLYDQWEFDGTTWTRVLETGPQVDAPVLVWNDATDKLVLLGNVDDDQTRMFEYDPSARTWNSITIDADPAKVPCVNDSAAAFDPIGNRILVAGGVCIPTDTSKSSPTTEEIWAWDGQTWNKVTATNAAIRSTNAAMFFAAPHNQLVIFGGYSAFTTNPRSTTTYFREESWHYPTDESSPSARSLFALATDPVNNVIWMSGGINEFDFTTDIWKFSNGFWERLTAENGPDCTSSNAVFDIDRARLVVVCADSTVFEFDNTAWKKFPSADMKEKPVHHTFGHVIYDQALKKSVYFGGMDANGDYQNKTWTWNGTAWTEVKTSSKKRAHARALAAMWYDPILRKTVLFGGIGRKEREGRLERYNDMWSFDGSAWTEVKPQAKPSVRYGAQVAVNPINNRTILHGGLRLEVDDKGIQRQVYANDVWEWDGATWRQMVTENAPRRENAAMAWDPAAGGFILFGGWTGYFHSDTWRLDDSRWTVFAE